MLNNKIISEGKKHNLPLHKLYCYPRWLLRPYLA